MPHTLAVIGFSQPDSLRVLDALRARDRELRCVEVRSGQLAEIARTGVTAALIWHGPLKPDTDWLQETINCGLPALLLVQSFDARGLNPSRGVVEYCFPPFVPDEVLARLDIARLRMRGPAGPNVIKQGELQIDLDSYEVTLAGAKVDLTYKEYELLKFLASSPGRVFSREALLRSVWEYDYFGGTRTVDVHIRRLRSKMDDVRNRFIETVWNVGYRFSAPADGKHANGPDSNQRS